MRSGGGFLSLNLGRVMPHEVHKAQRRVGVVNNELHNEWGIDGGLFVHDAVIYLVVDIIHHIHRSEERRVGKECRL